MSVLNSRHGCFILVVGLLGVLIIVVGLFVGIPVWLVYSAAVIVVLVMLILTGFNIVEQILRKRAGKSIFPKGPSYRRLIRIIQAVTWFSISLQSIGRIPLDPITVSQHPSLSVVSMLMIAVGIMLLLTIQHVYPQIVEHGVFDLQGKFYLWSDIGSFAWESYAKRFVFKIKGKLYQKIVVDNISPEIHSEIYPYLELHVNGAQTTA